jgi:hypothetical protein
MLRQAEQMCTTGQSISAEFIVESARRARADGPSKGEAIPLHRLTGQDITRRMIETKGKPKWSFQCSQAEPRVADAPGADADHGAPALRRSAVRVPQRHHEVRANRRDFLRYRIARHFRSLPRQGPVSVAERLRATIDAIRNFENFSAHPSRTRRRSKQSKLRLTRRSGA